ncbi:HepT-like ribonuclease domain-containing protein [Glaciibacter superstes]|uniref:HepT-like ribonuclease domain-containing protein n=1 Tax=Glaciibacter superstes TaxID=501023 RepID=UPI0003B5E582|nr:HepT-like ribonuclease domain-containing protein [Glaciibacter superstes]
MDRLPAVRDELEHILVSLDQIANRGEAAFLDPEDEILYLAGSHLIVNFDDLAQNRLPQELRNSHPEIPWKRITRTRNILAHDYLAADREIVWVAVSKELPELVRLLLAT